MRIFDIEINEENFKETIFGEMVIVDDRNPLKIRDDPVPHISRVSVHRVAPKFAVWPRHKLDGSPDFRFNPIAGGGGEVWTPFELFMERINSALNVGDIFLEKSHSGFPVMKTDWNGRARTGEAAVLMNLSGWSIPLYFKGEYHYFCEAVQNLNEIYHAIDSGNIDQLKTIELNRKI